MVIALKIQNILRATTMSQVFLLKCAISNYILIIAYINPRVKPKRILTLASKNDINKVTGCRIVVV